MFKFFKKIPWNKIKLQRRLRGADELFLDGKIFDARDKELTNILKELTSSTPTDEAIRHKEIIRAITVLTIKNNRYANLIQFLLIILTIFALYLAWEQTNYTEVATRAERIKQNMTINQRMEYCKQNPGAIDTGLFFENDKPATCQQILK